MFTRIDIPQALIVLASRQGGVFSTAQAEGLGVTTEASRRMRRGGHWHRVAPAVWSTTSPPSWAGLAWAGILQCRQGVLGGAAAGHLYGLCEPPAVIDVWAGEQLRRSGPQWRFRHGNRRGIFEPARVRIEDAALEMCEDESEAGIVALLAGAVGTRRTTTERLRFVARDMPNLRNRRLVLEILADVADGVESPLERRYLIDVERAHGLPAGERQVTLSRGTRSDVGYLTFRVLVELDGRVWHEGVAASADMLRDNQHRLTSWTTLRFGWHAVVNSPCMVASQVSVALRRGGWTGVADRCPRCS